MYKFHTDSFFTIGHTHEICQDYAFSGITANGIPFAVVTDGCSSSNGAVDFGARIMAHALKGIIEDVGYNKYNSESVIQMVIHDLKSAMVSAIHEYGLSVEDFLVTVQAVFIWNNEVFHLMYGDGVHMLDWDFMSWEFSSGAPYYLGYDVGGMRGTYMAQFGDNPVYLADHTERTPKQYTVEEYIDEVTFKANRRPLANSTTKYAVGSDGLKSFSLAGTPCTTEWVVDEIMGIKNFNNGFLKRRMKRFLSKETLTHYDDVSVAMIVSEKVS